ncbi:addiction module RelE/StbE family toxin [Nitrosomonas ureae]|uniref:type II toxin-antitoxin system RelE/ParE family toxin n=1 Tax=Nitrosomonas ureae TaxID=44577 RepID=UPI000D76B0B8|nr:type II toxin-antitoxin system mRNA interferase toxin, RelE/StbE family [Nitrosomonas ureae]PXX14035.1 addiction module RelE/StbE family toxin [Nitrosomonas ureae]
MSYTLVFTDSYKKRARRFAQKHPELKESYRKTLELLAHNPYHHSLRIHPLKGKLSALHSISINLSYRITLEILITEKEIILINVGSHDEVYQAG